MIDEKPEYIPLGTTANKQGKIAGQNIGGECRSFGGVLGSQITKIFDLYIGATGMTPAVAAQRGFQCASCSIVKGDRASYYPGGTDTHLTLVFEKQTGRLLGGMAAGGESISGRLNVLATAIAARMTLEQLNAVDFVYAPPVAPVYDPLLIAASQGLKLV
jgi:NADPH-dependent 2,4-dienoyl-CoA reductase/sulfur reductase-like enzyme